MDHTLYYQGIIAMKSLASTVTLLLFLLLPILSSGSGLPQIEKEVLLEGTVEAISWPNVTILTNDGGTVRVSIPYHTRTFLAGDEIELYASCSGDGTDCKFRAWSMEPEIPDLQSASVPRGPVYEEKLPMEQEGYETIGTSYPYRYHPLRTYDYGFIYRASTDTTFTRLPSSRATGDYFKWSGIIAQVVNGRDDLIYIVPNVSLEPGFAFTHIKKADGPLQATGAVTVVGKYKSNFVYTSGGRIITVPLLYDCHVSSSGVY
jgi:hypothetical protein